MSSSIITLVPTGTIKKKNSRTNTNTLISGPHRAGHPYIPSKYLSVTHLLYQGHRNLKFPHLPPLTTDCRTSGTKSGGTPIVRQPHLFYGQTTTQQAGYPPPPLLYPYSQEFKRNHTVINHHPAVTRHITQYPPRRPARSYRSPGAGAIPTPCQRGLGEQSYLVHIR